MHLTEREWNEKKTEMIIFLWEQNRKRYEDGIANSDSVAEVFMKHLGYTKEEPKP